MLHQLHRLLLALTVVTIPFLMIAFYLTSQPLAIVDSVRSFLSASVPEGKTANNINTITNTTLLQHLSSESTSSQSPTSTTVTVPYLGRLQKLLVVSRTRSENTSWVREKLPDWPTAIYTVDDQNATYHTRKNKGHEAGAYLTYIVDHYEQLPEIVVFIHSHQKHKHGTKRARIFEGIDYDNLESIKALNLDFVKENGFANLRCLNLPGCPAEIQPFRPDAERDPLRPQERAMAAAWTELFLSNQVPRVLAAPCCAQFAVSGLQIRQRPKAEYERFLEWVLNTPLDDFTSGRVFEYLWHVIFGKDHVYCPEEEQCYARQYGTSSAVVHQYQNNTEQG